MSTKQLSDYLVSENHLNLMAINLIIPKLIAELELISARFARINQQRRDSVRTGREAGRLRRSIAGRAQQSTALSLAQRGD